MENVLGEMLQGLEGMPPECLAPDIEGMTSPRLRMLLNRLVGRLPAGECYFEIGCLRGATLISALLGHRAAAAHACDNWSQFLDWEARDHFFANLEAYKYRLPDVRVHEEDCFGLARRRAVHEPVGVFFYDGDHCAEAHRRAIVEFEPVLAPEAIVLVDDWNWPEVRRGTWEGIHQLRPKAFDFRELPGSTEDRPEQYWNGVGAFHLRRAVG